MKKTDFRIIVFAMIVLMIACQDRNQPAAGPSSGPLTATTSSPLATTTTAPISANNPPDKWLGQWAGVEGTYLLLSKEGEKYVVKIANLDGPKTYEGVAAGDHIEFKRDGKTESIRAASGEQTGMKWLMGEKNCLAIKFGSEGFCRK